MTERRAIIIGYVFILFPCVIIFLGTFGLIYLGYNQGILHWMLFPMGFIIGPLAAWLYWAYAITKWRIWSYSRVTDIKELLIQGKQAGFLHDEGSFFSQSEIKTRQESIRIQELLAANKIANSTKSFEDDLSVPEITKLSTSRISIFSTMSLGFSAFTYGLYSWYTSEKLTDHLFIILFGIGIFSLGAIDAWRRQKNTVVIGEFGIRYGKRDYSWRDIRGDRTKTSGVGRNRSKYLEFTAKGDSISINLDKVSVSLIELRKLLKTYKGRFKNKKS